MNRSSAWMTAMLGALAGCLTAAVPAWSAEVELGASREDVVAKLGEPSGMAMMRGVEVLYYPRGTVDLRDGEVVRSTVLSEAEYRAEQQRLAEEAEARRQAAEEAAARRAEEGRAKLAEIQEKDSLAGRSASQQLAFWQQFQRQYPEVDVSAEIRTAKSEVKKQAEAAAAFERRVQEELTKPPPGLSRSKMRRYLRGRSESAVAEREAEIRDRLQQQAEQDR